MFEERSCGNLDFPDTTAKGFMMKKFLAAVTALIVLFCCTVSLAEEQVFTLTYALYPNLPDTGYYQELIERRWAEIEPDIRLIRAE